MCGEEVTWYHPAQGLKTVDAILRLLHIGEGGFEIPESVTLELELLRKALTLAESKNIEFCLLLLQGSLTSSFDAQGCEGYFS